MSDSINLNHASAQSARADDWRHRALKAESQLTDAKRNEERAVGEVGEVQSLVLKLESDVVGLKVELSGLQHRAKRELATAVHGAGCDRVRLGAVRVRLHTLEAAVRAVEDDDYDRPSRLACLYALVPEVE